jgi:hypothetical protein
VQLKLDGVDAALWSGISRDLLDGNNVVGDPHLTFGGATPSAEIDPVRPDA